eukprot:CAMPEP_0172686390 /NCGR_PEP_ID=MMETSP1074-20121228/20902_1 /TAXON_ID=2916 /ORGANISM="Ceratium fusus, Strain PA161109" /LENGTH=88 /DNA_ID=CAMNT_0013505683 /DNA_START=101 /DNA_END=367 /DNA_ORIENTATION=+
MVEGRMVIITVESAARSVLYKRAEMPEKLAHQSAIKTLWRCEFVFRSGPTTEVVALLTNVTLHYGKVMIVSLHDGEDVVLILPLFKGP